MNRNVMCRLLPKKNLTHVIKRGIGFIEPMESRQLLSATLTTLVNANGLDLFYPGTGVIADAAGDLFGTTYKGGTLGEGTVYEVAAGTHSFTTLASLTVPNDEMVSGVIEDSAGNLYGETYGTNDGGTPGNGGYGTVFEVAAGSLVPTTLASFNGTDGANPQGGLLLDSAGNLYGSATFGGSTNSGTIFKIVNGSGTVTVLHDFDLNTSTVGIHPDTGLVEDSAGNLYGVSTGGIFKIAAGSGDISLYGDASANALIIDSNGNLFGTSGNRVLEVPAGGGASVTLATTSESTSVGTALLEDPAGDLFGETDTAGSSSGGTIFEVVAGSGVATTIYTIPYNPLGIALVDPAGGLAEDASGNLYGVTASSGDGFGESADTGTLFEISKLGGGTTGAAASQLAFSQQPNNEVAGSSIAPAITVDVEDSNGNIVTSDDSSVTIAIGTNPDNGTLNGTVTSQAVSGVATFSNLSISTADNGYTLVATDGALTAATSNSFNISSGGTASSTTGIVPTVVLNKIPSAIVTGQPIKASLKILGMNSTASVEKGFSANLFASPTPTFDTNTAILLVSTKSHTSVKTGKSAGLSIPIKSFPAGLTPGNYYLIAQTTDAAGNTPYVATASTVTVAAPVVTLAATASAVKPAAITAKKSGSIVITVQDTGNVNAVGTILITVVPSPDGVTPEAGMTLVATPPRHTTIKLGKPSKFAVHFKLPTGLAAGSYFALATISLDGATATATGSQFTAG